ncbi:unnamed protein product, partial [Meganyctiphanes norvegica]
RFISNFKCQRCQSLGSYIITKELFQRSDLSLNITYQCQNCSMSLTLRESNLIEVETPGCMSKSISHNLIQLAHAAMEIGLSYSQIETLLQSLGIPSPTLSIWKTSIEIASESVSDPLYSKQGNGVEQIYTEVESHNLSAIKTEEPGAVDSFNESNLIMIKEEPPEIDVKKELPDQNDDELFMEYNCEVIVPDVDHTRASKSIDQQGLSGVVNAVNMKGSLIRNTETIYIEERNSGKYASKKHSSEDEISCQWNVSEVPQKKNLKKRHIMTPKRYRDDFYCEDYRRKSSIKFVNKKRFKNRYASKKNLETDEHLASCFKAGKIIENNFDSDSENKEGSICNVEIIEKSNFNGFKITCALCGGYKYSNRNHYLFSLIPEFESITVKVALQILNLPVTEPKCKEICAPCFNYICSKFKFTLRHKIAEQKNIDIAEVKLSKIKVRMFEHLDKKVNRPEKNKSSNITTSSALNSNMQIQKVVKLNSANEEKLKAEQTKIGISEVKLSKLRVGIFDHLDERNNKPDKNKSSNETTSLTSNSKMHSQRVLKLNPANEVKLKRKKYLTKKMSESLNQQMMKYTYLTNGLKTDAISSHPMVQLMDVSLILPSEAFKGASVSVNRKSDILKFCKRISK